MSKHKKKSKIKNGFKKHMSAFSYGQESEIIDQLTRTFAQKSSLSALQNHIYETTPIKHKAKVLKQAETTNPQTEVVVKQPESANAKTTVLDKQFELGDNKKAKKIEHFKSNPKDTIVDMRKGTISVRTSLWDFLNGPEYRRTEQNFENSDTSVVSDVSLDQIPTAAQLLEQGNLSRRQKKFLFLSADALTHYYYAPKILVRDELVTNSKALSKVIGYTSFHHHQEQVFLVPNPYDINKVDVLVLSKRIPSPETKNQSSEVTLILYPDGNVDKAVSLFRFDHDKMLTHSTKRYIDKNVYYMNIIYGAHFHTTTEEEQLYQETCLMLNPKMFHKGFEKQIFGRWFANKLELSSGKIVDSLAEFLNICKNDFHFPTTLTTISSSAPLKTIPVHQLSEGFISKDDSFNLISDSKTIDFIQNVKYVSPTLTQQENQVPSISYDRSRLKYHMELVAKKSKEKTEKTSLNLEGAIL